MMWPTLGSRTAKEQNRTDDDAGQPKRVDDLPYHDVSLVDAVLADEADADHDAAEVAQVEDVVRLGGRRQQARHRLLVDLHYRRHQLAAELVEFLVTVLHLGCHHNIESSEQVSTLYM